MSKRPFDLNAALRGRMVLAESLFADLRRLSADGVGVTRAPYSEKETAAHDLLAQAARSVGLEVEADFAKNTYLVLRGHDRTRPAVIIGSHLDSVVCGGNYDGAAGVIAGLVTVAAMIDSARRPAIDIKVMAIRAEEGTWFGLDHIGSRAALGELPAEELKALRVDSKRPLRQHMLETGCDLELIQSKKRFLEAGSTRAYFELHIEQGPVLEQAKVPVGIVTGIRGSVRAHAARCIGAYTHSGAVPMRMRQDAVMAVMDLVQALRQDWRDIDGAGDDLVLTFGKLYTNSALHQLSKVPGEVTFTIDARSIDRTILDRMAGLISAHAERIAREARVEFNLGGLAFINPARMDPALFNGLLHASRFLDIKTMSMPSGAGHDAADFTNAGVPSAMVFVRNYHGSHNPAEHMEIEDFCLGTQLLAEAVSSVAA
ncbi:MAG: hydantoinase/carbamoylase family amidase [Proteobacteria bacterium]|nr:hydantoinase/carbamoylase family amidase [Pseudomonadota bacterium]